MSSRHSCDPDVLRLLLCEAGSVRWLKSVVTLTMSGLTSSREKLIKEENNIDEENNNTNEGFDDETDVSNMKQTSTGKDLPMDDGYLNRHHTLRRTVSRPNTLPEELPPLTVDTNLSCAGYGRRDMLACKTPRILR